MEKQIPLVIVIIFFIILFVYNVIIKNNNINVSSSIENFEQKDNNDKQNKNDKKDNENFTEYEGFKYSPKMSIDNIRQLKKGQKKMSNMIREFDRICRKHNIKYFLIGGSLIGVLAYGGWIPWDGDVDLEIAEEDYPRFRKVIQDELPETMWYQDKESDELYNHRIEGKIRELTSCYIDDPYVGKTSHQGLQVDVNIYKYNKPENRIWFPDNLKVDYLTYEDVYPLKEVPFEDFKVFVMNNSEKYLINNYGKDWDKDLPIEQRFPHEGNVNADKTCDFHYDKYPKLHIKHNN